MIQDELNFDKAESNKEKGINSALIGAGDNWKERAFELLTEFISVFPNRIFLTEDLRMWANSQGLKCEKSNRAWGGIIAKASKNNLIKFEGYRKTTNPKAHRTPAALWKAAI